MFPETARGECRWYGNRRGFGRIEKRPSGRYRAAYTNPNGRLYRAPITFDAKDDAIAWLAARRAEIQIEVWAPDAAARAAFRRSVPTLRNYGDKWLKDRKTRGREKRPTTRQHYRMILDTYIYPTFGDKSLDQISAEDVNTWYDALVPGRETIRAQAYSLLRTILTSAASERPYPLVPHIPAAQATPNRSTRLDQHRWPSWRRSSSSCPTATSSWPSWPRGVQCASVS